MVQHTTPRGKEHALTTLKQQQNSQHCSLILGAVKSARFRAGKALMVLCLVQWHRQIRSSKKRSHSCIALKKSLMSHMSPRDGSPLPVALLLVWAIVVLGVMGSLPRSCVGVADHETPKPRASVAWPKLATKSLNE